jgi:hypothetical protein
VAGFFESLGAFDFHAFEPLSFLRNDDEVAAQSLAAA